MNFECNGKIYSLPLAKPAEVGMSYSLEEYDIGGEDRAFLFLDSKGMSYPMVENYKNAEDETGYYPVDRQRICIATGETAICLWQMLCEVGVATKQLYRAEDFEPGGFMQVTLEYAREVDRVRAMDLARATEATRGKTREQLEAEHALENGTGLITSGRPS